MEIKLKEKNYADEYSINMDQYVIKNVAFKPNKTATMILIILCILVILIIGIGYVIDKSSNYRGIIIVIIITSVMFLLIFSALLISREEIIYNNKFLKRKHMFKTNIIHISSIKYIFIRELISEVMDIYIFYDDKYIRYSSFETNISNFILLLNLTKLGVRQLEEESFYALKKAARK